MTVYRVLVFGSTGVGKTSLCNTLTDQDRPVSSAAFGTTFETYTYEPFSIDGNIFYVTDTVGLNGSRLDPLSAGNAAKQLLELLHQADEGFNVLVHVFRGRRNILHDENYDFFVKEMTQEKIPTLLVVTGCENERSMSVWADENQGYFKVGCKYKKVIASCFAKNDLEELEKRFALLREESKQHLLNAILDHALREPERIYPKGQGFIDAVFTHLWNKFANIAGLPGKYRKTFNESVYDFLLRNDVPKPVAEALTKDILDILSTVAPPPVGISLTIMNIMKKLIKKPT
jgi:GTPase SAR1 family protein